MPDTKHRAQRAQQELLATRRRAGRGLVAGYLHELSGRHAAAAATASRPTAAARPARTA